MDIPALQPEEEASEQVQVSHSISVVNDGRLSGTSVTPEFLFHCANILAGSPQGDRRMLVDELLSILNSSDLHFKIPRGNLTRRKQCLWVVFKEKVDDH